MKHRLIENLRTVAEVEPQPLEQAFLSRRERLERWALVLERDPTRRLKSLGEIEFTPKAEQAGLRADGSPLTVAFEDSVLRADGLQSDRLGDAIHYFELSDRQAHRLLCSCMNGWSMEAGSTARRIRRLANPSHLASWSCAALGLAAATPGLLYLWT
jgi:hypothetical protein